MTTPTIPSPQKFRNQATGIGQTLEASEMTGARRSQRVSDRIPHAQRKHATGYPEPTAEGLLATAPLGSVVVRSHLRGCR